MNLLEQLSLYLFPRTRFKSADKHIEIRDTIENGRAVRLLLCDNVRESGMYLDKYGDRDPLFNYMKTLKLMVAHHKGLNNCLLFGGGGFVIPKLYLKDHPERRITVVEVDAGYVELAKKFFDLDLSDKRITVKIQDGYEFIRDFNFSGNSLSVSKYDLVIFDAYTGSEVSKTILSEYALKSVYSMMNPGGIYALNMINEAPDVISMQTHMTNSILKTIFRYTRIVPCPGGGNCILMASDRKI
ncbi:MULTISPECIES: spermidine synthase [unclassified Butyrivibrio]|uniref:spermidine synthase n=1 Tax=unclassified Butyrivibrio TaxID=2639466 RepID=UPI00041F3EA0|nr:MULTISPECIES: fused MFS/spermidine synthase [unclassified Butyrivibrio]